MVRYTLRAAASEEQSPRAMLSVNSTILPQVPKFQFCILACAVIELEAGQRGLTISLAGHPPPLFVRSGGGVKPLGKEGTLLGGVEDPAFTDETILLQRGDVVLFFTDGAMDRYDSGTRGLQEHLAEVGAKEDLNAEELAESFEDFVVRRRPVRWADDLALLVLRVAS